VNEVEFALWLDEVEESIRGREDPPPLMIAVGLTEREADLAQAELERRGIQIVVARYRG
jgi:hypothetical protein